MTNTELYHYGILGMKWGQRNGPPYPLSSQAMNSSERRQNTSKAPKSRRGMSSVERKWAQGKAEETDRTKDYKPRSVLTTKHKRLSTVKQMSDEELNDRIDRLNRESRYLQLEKSLDDLDSFNAGNTIGKVLSSIGNKVIIPGLSAAAGVIIGNLLANNPHLSEASIDLIKKTIEVALTKKK